MKYLGNVLRRLAKARGYYLGVLPPTTDAPQAHLARVIEALGVTCVVDVGAHHGQFGALVRSTGYRGRLLSFEPVPSSFHVLAERAARDPEWRCLPYALGAVEGPRRMHVTGASSCASFLEPSAYAGRLLRPESIAVRDVLEVDVRRLDVIIGDLVRGLGHPRIFLKMDTQGYDLEVLRGADGCLDRVVAVQSELSVKPMYEGMPDYRFAIGRMEALGFELSAFFPVALDRELRLIEMDCIMVRAGGRPGPHSDRSAGPPEHTAGRVRVGPPTPRHSSKTTGDDRVSLSRSRVGRERSAQGDVPRQPA